MRALPALVFAVINGLFWRRPKSNHYPEAFEGNEKSPTLIFRNCSRPSTDSRKGKSRRSAWAIKRRISLIKV